jgi:hypothetical protein
VTAESLIFYRELVLAVKARYADRFARAERGSIGAGKKKPEPGFGLNPPKEEGGGDRGWSSSTTIESKSSETFCAPQGIALPRRTGNIGHHAVRSDRQNPQVIVSIDLFS